MTDLVREALLVQQALFTRGTNPFGHNCQWCAQCQDRAKALLERAIALTELAPCGKHQMSAWRPIPPPNVCADPDIREAHCILCEEVQAAVSAESHRCQEMYLSDMAKMREDAQAAVATALERAAECVRQYPRYEHAISAILALTPSSAGAQAPKCSRCGKPETPTFTCLPCIEDIARDVTAEIEAVKLAMTPAPVPASGGSQLLKERDKTIAMLRAALNDAAELIEDDYPDRAARYHALLDQAQDHE